MKKTATIAALALLAAGCSNGPPIQTASGKPDVVLRGVEPACIREHILNGALTAGWNIRSSSDIQIVMERPAPPSFAAAMLSTNYSGPPYQRVTFNLVPSGPDLRMVADMAWVSNANTGFERVRPAQANANDQSQIEGLASRAEVKCAKKG